MKLRLPITNDRQSAHLKITGTLKDPAYKVVNGDLVFERTLHGLRNTVLLPAGWDVSGVSQSGTIGGVQGRVRRADQSQRREQLQGCDPRAEGRCAGAVHARGRGVRGLARVLTESKRTRLVNMLTAREQEVSEV